jgi:hypothetical protein
VSQEGSRTSSFLRLNYRFALKNMLHFSVDRNSIETVKESYLEDKFQYGSYKKSCWKTMLRRVVYGGMVRSIGVGNLYVSKRVAVGQLNHSGDFMYHIL